MIVQIVRAMLKDGSEFHNLESELKGVRLGWSLNMFLASMDSSNFLVITCCCKHPHRTTHHIYKKFSAML